MRHYDLGTGGWIGSHEVSLLEADIFVNLWKKFRLPNGLTDPQILQLIYVWPSNYQKLQDDLIFQ